MDTVSHSGENASGTFVYSLNLTDIGSTWVETRAVLGKGEAGILEAFRELSDELPFAIQAIDADNGGEFINHLLHRYRDWFGVGFEFLLYDVTSTYFEGLAEKNDLAARGYSRDSRPDCKQVCIGLVVTPEGLPVAYEVFAGNRNDVTTLEEIVEMMERKYGQAQRVWVFDRGISSEENLAWLRQRGATYLVGTPKSQLKRYQAQLLDQSDWQAVREGLEVKRVCSPEGPEQFILCRSTDRAAKESAMLQR